MPKKANKMPVVDSTYVPPRAFRNPHLQTILPALFRSVPLLPFKRERLELTDGDFLDLDWMKTGGRKLAILTHGLEGSTRSKYISALGRHLLARGVNVLAWNFRGCSGEPNRIPAWYHSGKSEDLRSVIQHVESSENYDDIFLVGFSVGGNVTLKYLGEGSVSSRIAKAVTISVPIDLGSAAEVLAWPKNKVYLKWFLSHLKNKVTAKHPLFPSELVVEGLNTIKNFREFDARFTAPLNGFLSADEYWTKASCKPYLRNIKVPTLLLTARDDPFLSSQCYPEKEAEESDYLTLEITQFGGHLGFLPKKRGGAYHYESRTLEFLDIK